MNRATRAVAGIVEAFTGLLGAAHVVSEILPG